MNFHGSAGEVFVKTGMPVVGGDEDVGPFGHDLGIDRTDLFNRGCGLVFFECHVNLCSIPVYRWNESLGWRRSE